MGIPLEFHIAKSPRGRYHQSVLSWVFLVGLVSLVSTGLARNPVDMRIGVSVTPLSAPFVVAEEKGFFADQGLNVRTHDYIGGNRTAQAMLRGDEDFATSSEAVVMFNSFRRSDFVVLASFVSSDNDVKILTTRDSGIHALQDLAGRKVGTIMGASAQFFLDHTLLMHGVDGSAVEMIGIEPENTTAVLRQGKVDAVASWEPYVHLAQQALGSGARLVPHDNFYTESFNLLGRREYVEQHPGEVKQLMQALVQAEKYLNAHPDEAKALVARRFGKDPAIIRETWKDLNFSLGLEQWLISTLETEARWALERGLVEGRGIPNYLDYIYSKPLEQVAPECVGVIH